MESNKSEEVCFDSDDFNTIRAIGNFLSFYYKDLNWIKNFQDFIKGDIEIKTYLNDNVWGFNKFLATYRIARNRSKKKKFALLKETFNFIKSNDLLNVNEFAKLLKKKNITKGNAVSLSSKILFLNNPFEIFPFDSIVKKLFDLKNKKYDEYLIRVNEFKSDYGNEMNEYLNKFDKYILVIEKEISDLEQDIKEIRLNRFIDIYLWTVGGSN